MKKRGILTILAIIIFALLFLWSVYRNPPAPNKEQHVSLTWVVPEIIADFS